MSANEFLTQQEIDTIQAEIDDNNGIIDSDLITALMDEYAKFYHQKRIEELTEEDIIDANNKSYLKAGHNAYFGNGFNLGAKFVLEQLKKIN